MTKPRTLYEKIWDDHVVRTEDDGTDLLFIDLHLVHEVTSPQAFEALEMTGRTVRRPDLTLATIDHGVPTADRALGILDPLGAANAFRRGQLDVFRCFYKLLDLVFLII